MRSDSEKAKGLLEQKRTCGSQIFPSPARNEVIEETPPVFSFLRDGKEKRYRVVVCDVSGQIIFEKETEKNYVIPKEKLAAGSYRWNLFCGEQERGWWDFYISENAVVFLRPQAPDVFETIPDVRPRHLFLAEDIPEILKKRQPEMETLRRNIEVACSRPLPKPPLFYSFPNQVEYREYFGAYREYCDRDLVACALGHALLKDRSAGLKAKELLLTICSWNPDGPCAVDAPWNDEIGLSNARCLPAVYDLLYDSLSQQQKYIVEKTIIAYAKQCRERLHTLDFTENPGDSHAGRLPAYLGEAAMVLKGSSYISEEPLILWLSDALEIYGGIFPFYGTSDGGWAEGPFYASSYTRWYLPFFMAVERYADVRFLNRPFYQRLSQFFLHFAEKGRENHPFGDGYWCGSEDSEWPGFFAQNPFRLYGERFGPDEARQKAAEHAAPKLFELHLLDVFLPTGKAPEHLLTGSASPMAVFEESGLASCQTNLANQAHGTGLLVRASKFGSVSHQHADQGSFALIRNNHTLISPSGYFGRCWGTKHHRNWTKTTKAHNCILVDGIGQEADSHRATGRFVRWEHDGACFFRLTVDLAAAYPMLQHYERTFELTERELIIHDEIQSKRECRISWLLHMLSRPTVQEDGSLFLMHQGECAVIIPDHSFSGKATVDECFETDVNDGVADEVQVTMPEQYHVAFQTAGAKAHHLCVKIRIL